MALEARIYMLSIFATYVEMKTYIHKMTLVIDRVDLQNSWNTFLLLFNITFSINYYVIKVTYSLSFRFLILH